MLELSGGGAVRAGCRSTMLSGRTMVRIMMRICDSASVIWVARRLQFTHQQLADHSSGAQPGRVGVLGYHQRCLEHVCGACEASNVTTRDLLLCSPGNVCHDLTHETAGKPWQPAKLPNARAAPAYQGSRPSYAAP